MHAGTEMPTWNEPFENASLPLATTGRIPAPRAFAKAVSLEGEAPEHGYVKYVSPLPRLMLIARMLYVAWFEITKLIAATCVDAFEVRPLNTSRPRTFVSGATPTTMPETLVPCRPAAGS